MCYSHRPDPATPIEETLQALVDIVRSGKALHVALSNYSAEQTLTAADYLAARDVKLLLHQPQYSLFARQPETDLFNTLRNAGIGAAVYSPLAQGVLTEKYIGGTALAGSRATNSWYRDECAITEEYLARIPGIKNVADEAGLSIAQLAIAWVLRDPTVTTAIIGASRPEQIDEAISASRASIDDAAWDALNAFAAPPGGEV